MKSNIQSLLVYGGSWDFDNCHSKHSHILNTVQCSDDVSFRIILKIKNKHKIND